MHIKQLIISGFRSFRNQREIESFSPKHNVIVGRNGSGKSNFFDAIQFVLLAPKFYNLRQEDRQQLLHEGAGSSVVAAYVEIIFDNSDGRFTIESDEVVIRRTVGHKKDEFFINRKRVQKTEVMSLLESAGFSRSNPYYIVQQGKVAHLCMMKDSDRLELLKTVAGTDVYEERRAESLKILQETISKQDSISDVLKFIEDRLSELEQEKKELSEYERLDTQKRAIEFCIYDREVSKASEQLKDVELQRDEARNAQEDMYSQFREFQDTVALEEEATLNKKTVMDRLLLKRNTLQAELSACVGRKTAIDIEISEGQSGLQSRSDEIKQLNQKYREVTNAITAAESELQSKVEPDYERNKRDLDEAKVSLESIRGEIEGLYGKQGRGMQFTTVKDRNKFLQSQITNLQTQVDAKVILSDRAKSEILEEDRRISVLRQQIEKSENQKRNQSSQYEQTVKLIQERVRVRNEMQEARKNCWRDLEAIQEQLADTKQNLERGNQILNGSLPRHITQGLAMVEQIAAEKNITGYFGPLIDNFELTNDAFRTAVEVSVGNALFHVIVENDEIAAYFMNELERRKSGRLTFLPLNKLRQQAVVYPDSNDVRPLIDVALNYDPDFELAIRHVFGRKLLARDLETATLFSKEFDLDAITKDGDVVNRKGGFEGGFRDERESKFGAVLKIREARNRLTELEETEKGVRANSDNAEKSVNEIMREIQKYEAERDHLRSQSEELSREIANNTKLYQSGMVSCEEKKKDLNLIEKELVNLRQQIQGYEAEKKTEVQGKMSESERTRLHELIESQGKMTQDVDKRQLSFMKVNEIRDRIKADLKNNLNVRKMEIEVRLQQIGGGDDDVINESKDLKTELAKLDNERKVLMNQIGILQAEITQVDAQNDSCKSESALLDKSLDKMKTQQSDLERELADATKNLDKMLNKRTMLLDTIVVKQRMTRDLGTIPKRDVDEQRSASVKDLLQKLKSVNEKLKKYSGVNRKALDQYVGFKTQRDQLKSRTESLSSENDSITDMIKALDNQKDEAILRTFRGVSHHFSEVFAELVPGGHGSLIMTTSQDDGGEDANIDLNEETAVSAKPSSKGKKGKGSSSSLSIASSQSQQLSSVNVNNFQGVQVRVSFTGTGQQFEMHQLSGGQKALVALALIFSIQRCDPAPFYLFDEIDQALDANYRAGVARLIQRQVESEDAPAQFITTTFRPELVDVASKCFGIALQNKVSNIYPLDKAEAQKFVTDLMNEEEAVGGVTAVANFSGGRGSNLEEGRVPSPSTIEINGAMGNLTVASNAGSKIPAISKQQPPPPGDSSSDSEREYEEQDQQEVEEEDDDSGDFSSFNKGSKKSIKRRVGKR